FILERPQTARNTRPEGRLRGFLSAAARISQSGVELRDLSPGFLGGFDEGEEIQVIAVDDAFAGEELEADRPLPELAAEQQDRKTPDLESLDERERLEQLVEGPE